MRHNSIVDDEAVQERDLTYRGPVNNVIQTFGRPEPVVESAPKPVPRRFGLAALTKILGKKPAPATIDDKIAALHGEISVAEARQRAAAEKLKQPGLLTDAEHQQAEADEGASRRAIVRARDLIQGLQSEREVLAAAEAKAAFLKHVEAARVRAAEAHTRLANEYEPAAKLIASILEDAKESQAEIVDLMRQGREFGETVAIESPFAARGVADGDVSFAVALQRSDLMTDVSLPALLYNDPDIVPPDAALARRLPRLA